MSFPADTPFEENVGMYFFTFLFQAILLEICAASYVLETSYTSANWLDEFSFFTVRCLTGHRMHASQFSDSLFQSADPTAGYVNYVDQTTATNNGYINTDNGHVYMGVDSTNIASGSGRNSVRITSNAVYNYGLFALDVSHMPGGICGTWYVLFISVSSP